MRDKINLLEEKFKKYKDVKKKRYLTFICTFALITYSIIVAITFIYWNNLTKKVEKLTTQIKDKEKIITSQERTEREYFAYQHRLSQLTKIINDKQNLDKYLDGINLYLPAQTTIEEIVYSKNNNIIVFSINAANSKAVSQFLIAAKDKNKLGYYLKKIEIQGLSGDKSANYFFQVSAKLRKNEDKN